MEEKLILKTRLSPGDICTLTAAIESLYSTYPGRFLTDVRTSCDAIFEHNPNITHLREDESRILEMHYSDLISNCNSTSHSFLQGYCHDLGKQLGLPLELTTNRPHLYLNEDEKQINPLRAWMPRPPTRYWLISGGVKRDYTLKQWPTEYYQEVVNRFAGRIIFVQVGSAEHDHPPLDGVINLVGRTSTRQLIRLAYHAQGSLGPITFLQHLAAAFEKPYIALVGGREPVTWTQYPLQTTLHTMGQLPCCRTQACWRSRVVPLNDGEVHDARVCELPVLGLERPVGKCMAMIQPSKVVAAISAFYEGGVLSFDPWVDPAPIQQRPLVSRRRAAPDTDNATPLDLVAHSAWGFGVQIVPASVNRAWMDATEQRFAYHCLPMVLANQSGWVVLAPHDAEAQWNGGSSPADLQIYVPPTTATNHAQSQVGSGILTWTIPYVFRTPPGWNLLCRGPANYVKDGVVPLEGLVETDWSFASFSVNWKLSRPGRVEFKAGEPIAMLVPEQRGLLERFSTRFAELKDNPELEAGYGTWIKSRHEFWKSLNHGEPGALKARLQRHYFRGTTNHGVIFPEHQKNRDLARFSGPFKTAADDASP